MSLNIPFWPLVREALREDLSKFDELDLRCLFCLSTMVPAGDDLNPGQDPEDICRGIFILPCGHMFGHQCWTEHKAKNSEHHCVICNTSFWHSDPACKHSLEPFDFTDTDDVLMAPLCLQEGSEIPKKCLRCLFAAEAWIMGLFVTTSVLMTYFPHVDQWSNLLSLRIACEWSCIDFDPDLFGQDTTAPPSQSLDVFTLDEFVLEPPQLHEDRMSPSVWAPKAPHLCLGVRAHGEVGALLLRVIELTLRRDFNQSVIVRSRRSLLDGEEI